MKNIRGLVKEELTKRGYEIEISEEGTKKCHTKGIGYSIVKKEGIKLVREIFKNRNGRKEEVLTIYRNNLIGEEEIKEIVNEIKKDYRAKIYDPYIEKTEVYVY